MNDHLKKEFTSLFDDIKSDFLDYDPASYMKNNLNLDGQPFSIQDNGWNFMLDIYRYIAMEATRKTGKPVVLCKGRQIGGSVMAGALDLYFTNSGLFRNPGIRVAHLFPSSAQVKKFSQDKLESLIRTSKDDRINKNKLIHIHKNAVDNMTMKQFKSGTLWLDSLGVDGDRVRGMTLDVGFFDEVQDMTATAISNTSKTLTAAKYGPLGNGVKIFFGTPKARGAYFHKLWEASDQRYFHLGCKNCNGTYPFYLSADQEIWKRVWLREFIIKCPLCGCEQHKIDAIKRGKWVPTRDSSQCKYVGFHLNQLYIPYFPKEAILDEMPEHNPVKSERSWNNEVLGEFYSGVGLPLSRSDIYENAFDPKRNFSKSLSSDNSTSFLGVDWGGKIDKDTVIRGQSFSCVVILSEQPDGVLFVEHAHKLTRHNFSYKKESIIEMLRRFDCVKAVSDWFYGQDVVTDLQIMYGDRVLGAQGSGSLMMPVKYREDDLMIGYNKDLMIDEVFSKIRNGNIRFPGGNMERVDWLIDHCTSMEGNVRVTAGQQIKTFDKGSTPNDGLMALMYAYIAFKFHKTNKFKDKLGLKRDLRMPLPTLAYAPKLK